MSPWQFTIFRIVFGLVLAARFSAQIATAGPRFGGSDRSTELFWNPLAHDFPGAFYPGFVGALAVVALAFAAGFARRTMAWLLFFGWLCLDDRNPLVSADEFPHIAALLVLCAMIPRGEPWSFGKKQRLWSMPQWIWLSAWVLLAFDYTSRGILSLLSPGEVGILGRMAIAAGLLFAPLALWGKSRPFIWSVLLLVQIALPMVSGFAALDSGLLLLHLFTFDPAWLPPRAGKNPPLVLAFDGDCLMCSGSIRFLAAEDRVDLLRFLPLQSPRGREMEERAGGGTLETMLLECDGAVLSRSEGVLRTLDALGGHWRVLAFTGRWIPRPLRDAGYDFIAARRHRWFGKGDACALPGEALKSKLLDGERV